MAGARKLGVLPEVLQAMGKGLSCQGDYCHELLLGGPVSSGMQSLNRSQGIYDFVMCGRETAHRRKKGWIPDWKEGISSGSVPPEHTASTCGAGTRLAPSSSIILSKHAAGSFPGPSTEGPRTALLLTWVLLCPMEGS